MKAETFLDAVRASVAAGRLTDPGPDPLSRIEESVPSDLESEFSAAAAAVGGTVHRANGLGEIAGIVVRLMTEVMADSFLAWDDDEMPVAGLLSRLDAAGFHRMVDVVPEDHGGRTTHQLGYFDCPIGITGADAGLASTGSIVLGSGPGRPRMASLIPSVHIALLKRDRIRPSLRHWLAEHPESPAAVANWTVVTGPSKTADIEMVITHGVHGPRHVHVVLV